MHACRWQLCGNRPPHLKSPRASSCEMPAENCTSAVNVKTTNACGSVGKKAKKFHHGLPQPLVPVPFPGFMESKGWPRQLWQLKKNAQLLRFWADPDRPPEGSNLVLYSKAPRKTSKQIRSQESKEGISKSHHLGS